MSRMQRLSVPALMALLLVGGLGLLLRATAPQVPSNTWAPTASLSTARSGASASLLYDGRVLVTGGLDASGAATATVERYSAESEAYLATPPMETPRANHTATLLPDGSVLVAGGVGPNGSSLSSAEVYDPTANQWHTVASAHVARTGHTATALFDGRVVIAGGNDAGHVIGSIEVYDPWQESFSLVDAPLSAARTGHAAAQTYDGLVVIAGGYDGSAAIDSIDVFDPFFNTVTVGPALSTPRAGLTATTLLDGKILLLGGVGPDGELASADVYDPVVNIVGATANAMTSGRQRHQAILLPHNNQVLIVGGTSNGAAVTSAEVYVAWHGEGGTFFPTAAPSTGRAWSIASALSFNANLTIRSGPNDGLTLLAGGSASANAGAPFTSSDLYGYATVTTDQADYAPGTTVTISGSGWQPGETVSLTLLESPPIDTHVLTAVVADQQGRISSSEFVPELSDDGVRFFLTATGSASEAQTSFTDAAGSGTLTVTPTNVGSGTTNNFTFAFAATGGVTTNSGTSMLFVTIPNGWPLPQFVDASTSNYMTIAASSCTGDGTHPAAGAGDLTLNGQTVEINIDGCTSATSGFALLYNNVTVPAASEIDTFATTSRDGGASGTGSPIAKSPAVTIFGAATKLAFVQQPVNGVVNQPLSPIVVEFQDANGNRVAVDSGSLTIAKATGPGTLFGTPFALVTDGFARFSDLQLNATGTYTLTATRAGLTAATSASFDIVAAFGSCTWNTTAGVWTTAANWNCPTSATHRVPLITDAVSIDTAGAAVTIPSGASVVAEGLVLGSTANANSVSLTFADATSALTVADYVRMFNGNAGASTRTLNLNAGTLTVGRDLSIDNGGTDSSAVRSLSITSGNLSVFGYLVFAGRVASQAVLNITGAANLDLGGLWIVDSATERGTINASAASTITIRQRVTSTFQFPVTPATIYGNVHIVLDQSANSLQLNGALGPSNLLGNLRVLRGQFSNQSQIGSNGYSVVGSPGRVFEVGSKGTFVVAGATELPSGFARIFDPSSTIYYDAVTISMAGTISSSTASPVISGTGTSFTTVMNAGTRLCKTDNVTYIGTVASIASNTQLTLTANALSSNTNIGFKGCGMTIAPEDYGNLTISGNSGGLALATGAIGVAGTWTHSTPTFQAGSSTVTFKGKTASQSIAGTSTPTFNNLTIDKTAGVVTLARPVIVSGALSLARGIVNTTATNTLALTGAATATAGSALSYVSGPLLRTYAATGPKNFPIGKGGVFRPVTLQYDALTGTSTVTAEQFESSIGVTPPGGASLYVARFWRLSQIGSASFNYRVTLDGTGFAPTNPSSVVMVKNTSGVVTNTPATFASPSYTASGFTGFSDFALAEVPSATKLVFTTSPVTTAAGVSSAAMTVQRQDASSAAFTSGALTVNISSSSLTGTFRDVADTTTITSVTIPDGASTASFKYKDTVSGTPAVRAADQVGLPDTGLTDATQVETVTPGAPDHLVMVQQPTSTVSGTSVAPAVTVRVEDAGGNLVGSDTRNVTLAIGANPASGLLSGTTTVAAVGGVATFSTLSIDKAGVGYTLTATSAPALTSATSGAFDIFPRTTSLAVLCAPSSVPVNGSTTCTATATDTNGTGATPPAGSVAISSSGAGGFTGAPCTLTPAGPTTSSCTATYSPSARGSGTHNLTASYTSSDGVHAGSNNNASPFELTVTPASQVITFGALVDRAYGAAAFGVSATGGASGNPVTFASTTTSVCTTSGTNGATVTLVGAGECSITAAQAGNADYSAAPDVTRAFTVGPRALTVTATAASRQYNGGTIAAVTLSDDRIGSDVVTVTYASASFADKHVGVAKPVSVTGIAIGGGADAAKYVLANTTTSASADIVARTITVTAASDSRAYDATTDSSATPTVTLGSIVSPDAGAFTQTFDSANAGPRTLTAAGSVSDGNSGLNYLVTFAAASGTISRATATIVITPYNAVYDGSAHGLSGTATGVGGVDLGAGLNLGATFTHVPGGTANWTFTGGTNYSDAAGSGAVTISRAPSTTLVTFESGPYGYRGTAFTASAQTTGAGGFSQPAAVTYSGDCLNVTGPNGCTATATGDGDLNHDPSTDSKSVTITKAAATIVVTPYNAPYDGNAHGLSGTATGIGGVDLGAGLNLGATFTHVPGGTANWTFTGGANYSDAAGSGAVTIATRPLTVSATGVNKLYDATTVATVTLADDRVPGDALSTTYANAAFSSANVGVNKPVAVSGISLSGPAAGNYSFNTSAAATATIQPDPTTTTVSSVSVAFSATSQTVTMQATVTGSVVLSGNVVFSIRDAADTTVICGPTAPIPVVPGVTNSTASGGCLLPGGTAPSTSFHVHAVFSDPAGNYGGSAAPSSGPGSGTLSVTGLSTGLAPHADDKQVVVTVRANHDDDDEGDRRDHDEYGRRHADGHGWDRSSDRDDDDDDREWERDADDSRGVRVTLSATDADSRNLSFRVVTPPQHGIVSRVRKVSCSNEGPLGSNCTARVIYIPSPHYLGADTFTYVANDGVLDSNVATVAVNLVPPFTTFSQGAWGSSPHGGNPGAFLASQFSSVYPTGVQIGSTQRLTFTTAAKVDGFLPAGGKAGVLLTTAINPASSKGGVFAGHVLALALNVDFSNAGRTRTGLAAMRVSKGPLKTLNLTVAQVLALANSVLGGSAAPPGGTSLSDFSEVIEKINQNFENGKKDEGYLTPP